MPHFGQFLWNGQPTFARIEAPDANQVFETGTAHFLRDLWGAQTLTGESAPLAELPLLPPVFPSKLFAIGLNYADHAAEHGNDVPPQPLMWFKAPSSLLAHGETIRIAHPDHRTDYEAELALVIGKAGRDIPLESAGEHIFGFTNAQDISDRTIQRSESQWARAKSLDTYTPLGPFICTDFDPSDALVQTVLNGQTRQKASTSLMMFSPAQIVSFVSQNLSLFPGDVILTGTPAGVGALASGDILETQIAGLIPLRNPVV